MALKIKVDKVECIRQAKTNQKHTCFNFLSKLFLETGKFSQIDFHKLLTCISSWK